MKLRFRGRIVEIDVFRDHRDCFTEASNKPKYEAFCITTEFVQDYMSISAQKEPLCGLHWQDPTYAQVKQKVQLLMWQLIPQGFPYFWAVGELSAEGHRQFNIPRGFAHGFLTLTDDAELRYKCDNIYNKYVEGGMRYNTLEVNVEWGGLLNDIEPVLSEKDMNGPTLDTSDNQFMYKENC